MGLEEVQTGVFEVKQDQIFRFTKGIPGLEKHTEFAVIDIPDSPFAYLQSLRESSVSLIIADPFVFYPGYEFDLPDNVVEDLELGSSIRICCVLNLHNNITDATINLLAPIVFNLEKHTARQVILHATEYQTRHPLWPNASKTAATTKEGE
jgi:flagellar assembly factor FliW